MGSKNYMRSFGGGSDNLWETVDTIMVDLLHQGGSGDGDVDLDTEKANSTTKKKERELDEMMENLDTLLDDLRDISTISNDTSTPPRSITSSAEKIKPKRPTNEEFLEKENPLDSITQGLLYQTADVPLFASSEVPLSDSEPQSQVVEYNEEEESEEEEDWEEPNTASPTKEHSEANSNRASSEIGIEEVNSNRASSELGIEDLQLEEEVLHAEKSGAQEDTPTDNEAGNVEGSTSRLYAAAAKAEQIRRLDIKERISKYQELSKITEAQRQPTNKPPATIRPSKSYIQSSAKTHVHHHEVALPSNSYRSRPFSTATSDRPAPRALPTPPKTASSAKSPPAKPPSPTSSSGPSLSPTSLSPTSTSPPLALSSTPTHPPSPGPPRPPRPNAPKRSPQVPRKDVTEASEPPSSTLSRELNGTGAGGESKLNDILNQKPPPPLPSVPSPRHKKAAKRAAFTPSIRTSDLSSRSQIIGVTRQLRTSAENIHGSATSPIPIPASADSTSSSSSSSTSSSASPSHLDLNDPSSFETPPSDHSLPRETSLRRGLSTPALRDTDPNPSLQRIASQNSVKQKHSQNQPLSSVSASPSTSPPSLSLNKSSKSLRLTPVGQHRTPTRLIFGGEGISVQLQPNGQLPTSPLAQTSPSPTPLAQENLTGSNGSVENDTQGITSRNALPMEVKERNAKIKQLRDLMRRYRTKLLQNENKHTRDAQDLSSRIATGTKDAQIQLRSCVSWGQQVLTRACRKCWIWKIFVMQFRCELHTMQAALLQAKLELVEQLMTLLEIEYKNTGSAHAKNDFVIYSSFFKDPSEVMTSPEVERLARLLPRFMRMKRRLKLEFQKLRTAYQPEPPDRRIRRVKDILVRMLPSTLLPNYYAPDDILQADFDSVATDQRLLEGRHIQHLKNFLQEDLAGERTITPSEICDFLQQFAQKMAEIFGVSAQDASKLLLLSKRAIFPRIYHLLLPAIPASVAEQDRQLAAQFTWLQQLDPVVLREGLKLDKRAFQGPNSIAAFEPAIEALNELAFLIVPTDMSVAVHRAFKLTHDITLTQMRAQGGGGAEMGMDDVFPMFLWVVTQCNVARLAQCVYFMEFFSDNEERISILGYAATSLAAAVAHLSQIEKELFIN
eukprot:Phypoly_transcript_01282.p1 GENE.Phypoly_transcript_01282~~Phypoly_transcript_01282.p1  ORF type:complete len:1125 (+),score=279.27 Phypoly_transcript_01282:124-3498(+)